MIRNQEVATLLDTIAELLEAKGESVFRIGAYRRAAQRIGSMPEDIEAIWEDGRLEKIPGVGESIATKIDEFLRTGHLKYLDEVRKQVAPGLATLLLVPGIGTKRARMIWQTLGVASVADLGRGARAPTVSSAAHGGNTRGGHPPRSRASRAAHTPSVAGCCVASLGRDRRSIAASPGGSARGASREHPPHARDHRRH